MASLIVKLVSPKFVQKNISKLQKNYAIIVASNCLVLVLLSRGIFTTKIVLNPPKPTKPIRKKCNECGEALSGACISVLEKMFYQKCFTCSVCKKSIERYKCDKLFGDTFYCADCYKNRPGVCTDCGTRKAGGQFCGGCGTKLWETYWNIEMNTRVINYVANTFLNIGDSNDWQPSLNTSQ